MEVMDQRRNEIVEFVNENQTVTFTQLKEKFPSVSEMTLRTDLKYLDQAKKNCSNSWGSQIYGCGFWK